MKTLQEFEQYLESDTELMGDVKTLESQRKSSSRMFIYMTIGIFLALGGFIAYYMRNLMVNTAQTAEEAAQSQDKTTNLVYYFIFGSIGISAIFYGYNYIKRQGKNASASPALGGNGLNFDFKDKVVRKMITFWDPNFKYQINNHVKRAEIKESGMLTSGSYTVTGSDMISGEIDGVEFKFSDVSIVREKRYVGKNEDPYETVLVGSFFMANFNKAFKSPVYVYPSKFLGINSVDAMQHEGEKVHLEDPEFSKKYNVYSSDQIEARYILTPSIMERIKSLTTKMGNNIYFVFSNNRIYIANNNGKDRFETSFFKSVGKKESLVKYFNELQEQLSIIEELKLNVNIWNNNFVAQNENNEKN